MTFPSASFSRWLVYMASDSPLLRQNTHTWPFLSAVPRGPRRRSRSRIFRISNSFAFDKTSVARPPSRPLRIAHFKAAHHAVDFVQVFGPAVGLKFVPDPRVPGFGAGRRRTKTSSWGTGVIRTYEQALQLALQTIQYRMKTDICRQIWPREGCSSLATSTLSIQG